MKDSRLVEWLIDRLQHHSQTTTGGQHTNIANYTTLHVISSNMDNFALGKIDNMIFHYFLYKLPEPNVYSYYISYTGVIQL